MKLSLTRGCAALLAVAAAAPAWADHAIAGGSVSGSGPIMTLGAETLPAGKLAGGLLADLAVPDAYSDAELVDFASHHVHAHTTEYNLRAEASLSYGVTGHLMVSASLPFIRRDDLREGAHSHSGGVANNTVEHLGSVSGVGDLSLTAQYVVAHDHHHGWFVSLLGGLKVPTGSTSETDLDGNRLETEHQPGTGSWDPLFGLAAQKAWGNTSLHGSAFYQLATEGAQATRMGNRLNLSTALVYDFSGGHHVEHDHDHQDHPAWAAVIEGSYEWEGAQEISGVTEPNTGSEVLWLSPGLRFTAPQGWSAALSAGLPLWQDVGISHAENAFRVVAQVGTAF